MTKTIQQSKTISTINNVDRTELENALKSFVASQNLTEKVGPAKVEAFFQVARAFGLNPFKREIHAVPRAVWSNGRVTGYDLTIITGYEVYIKRANDSGLLSGFSVVSEAIEGEWVLFDESRKDWVLVHKQPVAGIYYKNMKATATIRRKNWQEPFIHEVFLNEVVQNSQPWKKQPLYMQKKVAIEQALRWVFPEQVGGLPYADDELPVESANRLDATKKAPVKAEPAQVTEEPMNQEARVVEAVVVESPLTGEAPIVSGENDPAEVTKKLKFARAVAALKVKYSEAKTDADLEEIGTKAATALEILQPYPDLMQDVQDILDDMNKKVTITAEKPKEDNDDDVFNSMKDI